MIFGLLTSNVHGRNLGPADAEAVLDGGCNKKIWHNIASQQGVVTRSDNFNSVYSILLFFLLLFLVNSKPTSITSHHTTHSGHTCPPPPRLGTLDDLGSMLHSWAGAHTADTQLALLVYVRQLADRLKEYGVRAAAVDVGEFRVQICRYHHNSLPVCHVF